MGFFFYLIFWTVLSGILVLLIGKYFKSGEKNKHYKKPTNEKITGYGGPDLDLPPGIFLEQEDDDSPSQNIKTSK